MAVGMGVLRLSPRDFWAMTPRELAAAVEGISGGRGGAMGRDEMAALMRRFPDGGQRPL